MILIEPFHLAVRDVVLLQFESYRNYEKTKEPSQFPKDIQVTISDFDGILYKISQNPESSVLTVSITLKFFEELQKYGASKVLSREYAEFLRPTPDPNCSVTLAFDYEKLPEDIAGLAMKTALLRRNCFASVFENFFEYQISQKSETLQAAIHFRADETMFVQAMSDRVTVIFGTRFKDPGDMVLGRVFLQEFAEARRRFDGAPQVLFSYKEPPRELNIPKDPSENIAYITFVMSPRHISEKTRAKTIDLIHTFRTYMHYHIKCMKAYLQMRMRAKTAEMLKILNRAHREVDAGTAACIVNVTSPTGTLITSGSSARAIRAV